MSDAVRPYLFYDVAVSICSTCFRKVEGKIVFEDDSRLHAQAVPGARRRAGADRRRRRVLPALPRGVHQAARDAADASTRRSGGAARTTAGCAPITSSTPACRWSRSPTTATSVPDLLRAAAGRSRQQYRTLEQIERMLDAVVRNEGEPDVVQISGGEPTIHPRVLRGPRRGARRAPIQHLMVNTNGMRIARDEAFAERLAGYMPGFEVYLQFDSLRARSRCIAAARRGPARRPPRGARAAERARHLDDAGRHAEEGPERRRDRRDHRLRARAALRARRDVPADPGGRPARGLRPGHRPADADRGAPQHPRADRRLQARGRACRCRAIPTAWRWPTR